MASELVCYEKTSDRNSVACLNEAYNARYMYTYVNHVTHFTETIIELSLLGLKKGNQVPDVVERTFFHASTGSVHELGSFFLCHDTESGRWL
jgi:hypothetical protein